MGTPTQRKGGLCSFLLLVLLIVVTIGTGVSITANIWMAAKKKQEIAERQNKLRAVFEKQIADAKKAGDDPCFIELFQKADPPDGLNDHTRFFFMGQEVAASKLPLNTNTYKLQINGDKIELWGYFVTIQAYGESARTWKKIGEKFSADSLVCANK